MDSSFTENVLQRARERQKKLAPLREANFINSHSNPNLSSEVLHVKKNRKEVVSEPSLCSSTNTPKMSRQNSKTTISSSIPGSPNPEINTLNIQKDSFNMEIKFSSTDNVRVEVEIDSDSENEENKNFSKQTLNSSGEESDNNSSASGGSALRESAKTSLQRLGKLYRGDEDLSSPIHRTESNFVIEDNRNIEQKKNIDKNKPNKMQSKLAVLTDKINQWEDDITHRNVSDKKTNTPRKSWKPPAPQPPIAQVMSPSKPGLKIKPPAPQPPTISPTKSTQTTTRIIGTTPKRQLISEEKETPKQIKWDKAVLDTLESQGFTRTQSNARLVYNFKNSQGTKEDKKSGMNEDLGVEVIPEETETIAVKKFVPLELRKENEKVTPRSPTKTRSNVVANKAALFEQMKVASPVKKEKDPALLSVSERKALFEKNPGDALIPKAAFGMSTPINTVSNSTSTSSNLNESTKSKTVAKDTLDTPLSSVAQKIAQLNKNKSTISQEQIENKTKEERQKEMEVLLNRFNHNKKLADPHDSESEDDHHIITETTVMIANRPPTIITKPGVVPPPPPPPACPRKSGEKRSSKGDSPQVQAILGDVKRIKVTQPKDGNLYPNLSDIEANTETDRTVTPSPNNSFVDESDIEANSSFGREILQAVCKDPPGDTKDTDSSDDSDVSDVIDEMNEYLCEYETDSTAGPTPPKHKKLSSPKKYKMTEPSRSFKYSDGYQENQPDKFKSPIKIITSPKHRPNDVHPVIVDGENELPLTYTVSFYRKQQSQTTTPIRKITREPEEDLNISLELDEEVEVDQKIEALKDEINKQQMIISQTSRALNLCNSTPEFTGSTEQVEAEKVLLLATHRRQVMTNEIQRLKVERTIRPMGPHTMPVEKGTLTISNIKLPLKKEYVRALSAAGGKGHHVVCLIKSGDKVTCTPLVSTVASSLKNLDHDLSIPGEVKLENIFSDFSVIFEVYCLQAQEEILPHEVKYHIGKKSNAKITPKKIKFDSKMSRPPKESPGGPLAVRTSSFALNGYVIFTLQNLNKTHWTLNKTPPISPLESSVTMKLDCQMNVTVQHHGFLNMFEDVSGLGAWHRRWCVLKGTIISYWKYPEDEKKKPPINTIDLTSCFTDIVGPVSREICARPNTFLLERQRKPSSSDIETLTVSCFKDKTIIKYLLSADTKEERISWCDHLNKALAMMRIWGSSS